jgi:DNA ligase D-like protein (predicted polymerase)
MDERAGVRLTNLDEPLFAGSSATKRTLIDYLDRLADRLVPALADRPLSVIRVPRDQAPFMQKNLPRYAPEWIRRVELWSHASRRAVCYALCDDRRTLLWLANQRAVEYHPTLVTATRPDRASHLVLDLDPPADGGFRYAVRAAQLVRRVLDEAGLAAAVKTSGAKGLHLFVPVPGGTSVAEAGAATRAIAARAEGRDPRLATTAFLRQDRGDRVYLDASRAGSATVAAVYSPRVRPGVPVSFPLDWSELEAARPGEFTVHTVPDMLGAGDPWARRMPAPRPLPADLVAEGREIPAARGQAGREDRRRARQR